MIQSELPAILAEIRSQAVAMAAAAWPELGAVVDDRLPAPMDPFALLPICTGIACGSQPSAITPLAAAIVLSALALRIVDDCADEDSPTAFYHSAGIGRAINTAAALSAVAFRSLHQLSLPSDRRLHLQDEYLKTYIRVCQGQDMDMAGRVATLEEYRALVQHKTVAAFEFAAAAGAVFTGADEVLLRRCSSCGMHLGWMIQILDDVEAFWFPDIPGPLPKEQATFPMLTGLTQEHPATTRLASLPSGRGFDLARARALLDQMGVREQLLNTALDHRDAALAALGPPLQPAGQEILQIWMDWIFRDGERLLGLPNA